MATFLNSQIDAIGSFLSRWDWLLGRSMPEMCRPRKNQKRHHSEYSPSHHRL